MVILYYADQVNEIYHRMSVRLGIKQKKGPNVLTSSIYFKTIQTNPKMDKAYTKLSRTGVTYFHSTKNHKALILSRFIPRGQFPFLS